MIGISGNANITTNTLSAAAARGGSTSEVQSLKAINSGERAAQAGTASNEPSLNIYQTSSGKH